MQFWTPYVEKLWEEPNEDILYDSEARGRGLNCRYSLSKMSTQRCYFS